MANVCVISRRNEALDTCYEPGLLIGYKLFSERGTKEFVSY